VSHTSRVTIQIGEVFASREPTVIRTVLGSCIAACLRDPATGIGGMNHFMLPTPLNGHGGADLARFGVHAMELLIGNLQKLGGERGRLQAKVFGGGHVLQIPESACGVPQLNIRFIREFLATEGIPLVAHDLGGRIAREVLFHTNSGKVLMKRLSSLNRMLTKKEQKHQTQARDEIKECGEITLFGDE
jgi:chemotaxis protein CheD